MADITQEELWVELNKIATESAEGATVAELAEQLHLSRKVVRDRLSVAKARGMLAIGRRTVQSLDGRQMWSPCYKIIKRRKP